MVRKMGGKEKLLAAAAGLFGKSPYTSVGVAQILEAAGVQAPTLYHHFADKEGLYVAWAEGSMARIGERVTGLDRSDTVRERLAAFASALLEDPDLDPLLALREAPSLSRPESGQRILNAYFTFVFEPLCSLLVEGVEAGLVRPDPIGRLADVFLMGTLALSPQYGRSGMAHDRAGAWWAARFLAGMGP